MSEQEKKDAEFGYIKQNKFSQQLDQIKCMGFDNDKAILAALEKSNGDIFVAIEHL